MTKDEIMGPKKLRYLLYALLVTVCVFESGLEFLKIHGLRIIYEIMGSMLKLMLRVLVFSVVIFSGAIVLLQGTKKASLDPEIATVYEEALPLPEFTLIDQKGLGYHSKERLL